MENKCCGKFVGGHTDDRNCYLAKALVTIEYLTNKIQELEFRLHSLGK